MTGGDLFPVKVTLRNSLDHSDIIDYIIEPDNNQLARDWQKALIEILDQELHLEKNFCFLGFPHSNRTIDYLCQQLNHHIDVINKYQASGCWQKKGLQAHWIEEYFDENSVRFPDDPSLGEKQLRIKHGIFNRIHNHFEILQGTVWKLSPYYNHADEDTKYAIRQLNNICHELESLILSQRKLMLDPAWVRPSQITTFFHARRYDLTDDHRKGFSDNGYNRELGGVYMHWTQIGKTLFEVWRDEKAPNLNVGDDPTDISVGSGATCEAITALKYYSGEFDIDWGDDVIYGNGQKWHDEEIDNFFSWIKTNGLDTADTGLSLGYLKIGQVNLEKSFGTKDPRQIWKKLEHHLDIVAIECGRHRCEYQYSWDDRDFINNQKKKLKHD
jgi:hypothetical protein